MNQDSLILDTLAQDSSKIASPFISVDEMSGAHINLIKVPEKVNLGDTFDLVVAVSWEAQGGTLLLLPGNSVNLKGLEQISVRQESGRTIKAGKEYSENQFIYSIVATDTGHFTMPAMKILAPISQERSLEFKTEPTPIIVESPYNFFPLLIAFVALCVFMAAAFWRNRRRQLAQRKKEEESSVTKEQKEAFLLLKQRVQAADSREWLLALEKVCLSWIKVHLGEESMEARIQKGDYPEWKPLMDEFVHARYGGGSRDSYMNLETWKLAAKLMNIKEED